MALVWTARVFEIPEWHQGRAGGGSVAGPTLDLRQILRDMARAILLPVVLTTIVGCGPLVGVASLTFEDAAAPFDASEHDDAIDSTAESDGSRDEVSEAPRNDATVSPDVGLADEAIDDATSDAEVGAEDAEPGAPDGADSGRNEGGGDAGADAADASPAPDTGSAIDAASGPDEGSDADDDAG
jgi:hypothetical protein